MSALRSRVVRVTVAFASAVAALIIPLPSLCAAFAPSPSVQRRTLPSGMRVIVAEQAGTTLTALDLRVRVGSGSENTATNGTAHFIEHLLFKGTDTRKPGEIDEAVETLGGELKAQTTRDATRFATVVPDAKWRDALAIIADMTLHPAFRPGDVTGEKPVILSEMAIARTEPMRAGFNALAQMTFGPEDPYRFPVMGSEENVRAMTPESLQTFWREWYRPQNMTLVIAGNIKAADVFGEAERLFPGTILPGSEDTLEGYDGASSVFGGRSTLPDAGGENLTTLFVGFRAPAAKDADTTATVAGLVSLLAERSAQEAGKGRLENALIARQRLAFLVTADYVAQRGESLVVLSVTGPRANAAKMETALIAELKKLAVSEFTSGDAAQARQNLRRAQASDGTVESVASRLALADVLRLSPEETDDPALYTSRLVRVVTPESLALAARRHLSLDHASIVVVRPPVLP